MIVWILFFLVILSLSVYALQILALKKKLRERYDCHYRPPISIIKPLRGLDDNLFDNIESFCKQNYPEYEIILSLQDYNDPAYRVAEKIQRKYPNLVRIVVDNSNKALNPKVKNMIAAYKVSRYEYFLISDSNVSVEPDYLEKTVSAMGIDVGVVTNLIMGTGGRSLGAKFENLQLNSFVILNVSFLDKFLKIPCSIGKSMLMRKKDFEDIGGFQAIKDVLAEDYLIGKLMHEKGKKVVLCGHIIKNVNEYWSIRRFLNRHSRWAKIRWKIAGFKYFTEPLNNPIFITSLIPLFDGLSKASLLTFLSIMLLKVLFDLHVNRIIRSQVGFSFILIPIKDLITALLWFIPFISSKITWRDNKYQIGKNTLILPYERNFSLRFILNKLKTVLVN